MIKCIESILSTSPLLSFEITRILAGATRCALPQQVFEFKNSNGLRMLNSVFSYISGDISRKKFEKEIKNVENEISKIIKNNKLVKLLNKMDINVIPFCVVVDRILNSKEVPVFPTIHFYVYSKSEKEYVVDMLDRIREIEIKMINSINKIQLNERLKVVKLEGELLGYPKCCVDEFLNLKKKVILENYNLTPEKKVVLELLELGMPDLMPKLVEKPYFDSFEFLYSLFSLNFYPCSVTCKKAIEIGKACEEFLKQFSYEHAYKCGLIFNAFYHIVTGYKSYTLSKRKDSEYLSRISTYYKHLKPDVREVFDSSKNVITDVNFINAFMFRCIKLHNIL